VVKKYSIYEARAKFSELVGTVFKTGAAVIAQRGVPVIRVAGYSLVQYSLAEWVRELERVGRAQIASKRWPSRYDSLPRAEGKPGAVKRFLDERD
jgi:prevent-host-death family protein